MWVVSQSIEQCARLLMGLHEEMRVLAFGNQNRTTVKLKTIDNMHLQFELRRVRKTSLVDTLAAFVIKGDLIYQSPSATQVSYRIQPNWFILGFVVIIMLFLCTLFAVIADLGFALFITVLMGFGISINAFILAWQANHLKKQLRSTLMHPDESYNPMNY